MVLGEAVIGIILYFFIYEIKFIFWAIGLIIFGATLLFIIIRTDYDPFSEFSCWAFILSIFFCCMIIGYFLMLSYPLDFSDPTVSMRIYIIIVLFSIIIYFTSWNACVLIRKKHEEETKNEI